MKQYAASNFENSKDGSSYACNLKYESSILPLREHEISQACSGLANQEISNVIWKWKVITVMITARHYCRDDNSLPLDPIT